MLWEQVSNKLVWEFYILDRSVGVADFVYPGTGDSFMPVSISVVSLGFLSPGCTELALRQLL